MPQNTYVFCTNAEQKIVELSGTIRKFPKFNNAHETFTIHSAHNDMKS